jgi:protein-arginine kinase activator protein McsA
MKNKLSIFVALLSIITLSFCSSGKKTMTASNNAPHPKPAFTYEKDVAPIMMASCSPCHFPESGKVKPLDTYEAAAKNIDDIVQRVQLPVDHEGYMPFKSKRPALTEREIAILKKWQEDKMPK